MGDTDEYAYLMVVMIKKHDDKVDGWSWFKAIRGREKNGWDTVVWMLMHICDGAVDDDKDSRRHDNKADGCSWFKAIKGREKRDTEVWMLISINAIDDDEDSRSHESKVDGWMGLKPARGGKERDSVILIIMQI